MNIEILQRRTLSELQSAIADWVADNSGATIANCTIAQTGEGLVAAIVYTPA
jgi:hypothetical protein